MLEEHIKISENENGELVGELCIKFECIAKTASSIGLSDTHSIINSVIYEEVKKFAVDVLSESANYDSILKANVVDVEEGGSISVMTCGEHVKKILEAVRGNKDKDVLRRGHQQTSQGNG